MTYLNQLLVSSKLSKKAIQRSTNIAPSALNQYINLTTKPTPRTLKKLFQLFRRNGIQCSERVFIEQHSDSERINNVLYCFEAFSGISLTCALSISRSSVQLWIDRNEIPWDKRSSILDAFVTHSFSLYSIEELPFGAPKTKNNQSDAAIFYQKHFNFPSDFAYKNAPKELRKRLGAYVFETPIYELPLKNKTIKMLIEKAQVYSLFDLLSNSISGYFFIDGFGEVTVDDIEVVHKMYDKEYETILKHNCKLTLMSPATDIRGFLHVFNDEFNRYANVNLLLDHFEDFETVNDFLLFDRWDMLQRAYAERGEPDCLYPSFSATKKIQSFICYQLGIKAEHTPCELNTKKDLVKSDISDWLNLKRFEELSEEEVDKAISEFHSEFNRANTTHQSPEGYGPTWETETREKIKIIDIAVDEQFVSALQFCFEYEFWRGHSHSIYEPFRHNRNTRTHKGYLSFFLSLAQDIERTLLILSQVRKLKHYMFQHNYFSLSLDIPQQYQNNFTQDDEFIAKTSFEDEPRFVQVDPLTLLQLGSYEIAYSVWDAIKLSIIFGKYRALLSLGELKNRLDDDTLTFSWNDILDCFRAWQELISDHVVGDEFEPHKIYKKYKINGVVFRRIIEKAESIGILEREKRVFRLVSSAH